MASTQEKQSRKDRREAEREALREQRRLLALGQIRRWGDPVLREQAREVEEFGDDLKTLTERMGGEEDELGVLVNPEITSHGEETEISGEGCLSLPSVHVPVERFTTVVAEGKDIDGEPVRIEAEGMQARVLQHELDHLNGVLILDRTTPEARREAMRALRPRPDARG
jgi:peptide deformylase